MASIEGIDIYTLPFIIGIYHGMSKPNDTNEFLLDFVNDFILFSQTGIIVFQKKYAVTLNAVLCDAPSHNKQNHLFRTQKVIRGIFLVLSVHKRAILYVIE